MPNKELFRSAGRGPMVPKATTKNAAGGKAYEMSPKAALARYACTGCFSDTFYVKAEDHLSRVLNLCKQVDADYIGKLAFYSRRFGFMKDMPAFLLAVLTARKDEQSRAVLESVFRQVIDNGRMLRGYVQIMRSGVTGRKSLGHQPRRLIGKWLTEWHDPAWIFRQSVGNDPSMLDILRLTHKTASKGLTPEQDAFFGYLAGKDLKERAEALPILVQQFEAWKRDRSQAPPKVPFEMLTSQPLTAEQWATIFRNGQWHFVKQNINTALRQKAFEVDKGLMEHVCALLRDPEVIRKVRVFPHQLLSAYRHIHPETPRQIVDAIHDAMEVAVSNVPAIEGKVVVIVDVSGSMRNSISGGWGCPGPRDKDKRSKIRCVDVASLLSSAILRQNRDAVILPVDTSLHTEYRPEPRDTIITNANRLAAYGGGGTNISLAMEWINARGLDPDVIFSISDGESWADYQGGYGTNLAHEFAKLRSRKPGAKLVCVDVVAGKTSQAPQNDPSVLQVSGWSDLAFKVVDAWLRGNPDAWVETIEKISIN